MKLSRFINLLAVLSMLFAAFGLSYSPAVAQGDAPEFDRDALYVPGELIVQYGRGVSRSTALASAQGIAKELGGQVMGTLTVEMSGTSNLLSFNENADIEALAQEIATLPGVAKVEPNYIRWIPEDNPMGTGNQPTEIRFRAADGRVRTESLDRLKQFKSLRKVNGKTQAVPTWPVESYDQWGWWSVNASIIWPEKAASANVCVIDTGVDVKHPDLIAPGPVAKAINGFDYVNDDPIPNDDNGHGTHVSGTIVAVMNNKKGFSGISNGKVVGVKVLTAQGWGTSWDISQGIYFCANRSDVKVINMSLGGGGAGSFEYNALNYAINTKNKLVVAAAGNASTSSFSFPGAWAAPFVCANGANTYPAPCGTNTIHQGLLSVGAARPWWSADYDSNEDGYLWVDINHNSIQTSNELFYPDQCASSFSNYGAWVEIVAPGEDILSTVPVSYPFHDEYYWGADGDNDGYEWFSGTSMATPHVAAGAARAWSLAPTATNAVIANLLISSGDPLALAMDSGITNPADGYRPSAGYSGEVPYCWPDNTKGGFYGMTNARYLNVAGAMNRGALWVGVYDAVNGLPLPGTTVKGFLGASLRDQAKVVNDWEGYVPLLNLPGGANIDVKINKPGYTAADVWIAWQTVDGGYHNWGPWLEVGVPPINKRIHAVLSWWDMGIGDLDFFMWTPNVSAPGFVVGPYDPAAVGGDTNAIFVDEGDFLTIPYARWNREGGFADWLPMESISIAPKPGSTTIPYFNLTANDYYDFLATDYWGPGLLNGYAILRVWANGKIIGVSEKTDTCDTDGPDNILDTPDDEIWWWAGFMRGSTYYNADLCGTGEAWDPVLAPNGAFPYRVIRTTLGTPEGGERDR